MEQIEDEVKSARQQAQLTSVGHPDRVTRLHDLGDKLERLYNYTQNIEHLDEAISVSHQVTQIPPINHLKEVWKLNNLASKICLRYLCTKKMDDLDECIKVSRQAVQLTPFSDDFLGFNMYNLGSRLRLRYKHTGKTEHLREAFSVCGQELQHEPPDRDIILTGLKQLGELAEILYQRTGKIEDLEEAIAVTTQVVQLIPEREWDYTEWLDKLGDLVEEHYKSTENMKDLDEAIRISRHVVQRTYPDHPNFDKRRDNLDRKIQLQSQSTRGSTVENLAQQLESLQMGSVDSLPQIGSGSNIPTSNQLCRLCQTVFERDDYFDAEDSPNPTPKSWILHHHEDDLEDSASAGCHLCSLILCALQWKRTNPFQEDLARMPANADFGRQIGLGLVSSLGQGGMIIIAPKSESSPFQTFATSLSFTRDLGILYNQRVDSENYSKGMILQMKNWLSECKSRHEFCKNADLHKAKERGDYHLPSRLLRVKYQGGSVSVHLTSTENLPRDTKYMTLSYRWPKASPIQLTAANEAFFRQQIALLALPRTIQDAILLVNALGYQYLWVDALCIIQDSEPDWLQESTRMCDYYSHSALSISACTSNPDSGFLKTRNPLAKMPCKVTPKGKFPPVYVRQHSVMMDGEIDPLKILPLNGRGWVFQERLLAPRIVHFTDVEVFWECATALSSDIFPDQIWDSARKRSLAHAGATLNQTPVIENFLSQPGTLGLFLQRGNALAPMDVNMWTELVEEYSTLDLSFERDKLVAIGGLARKTSQVTCGKLGRYLAGLWEKYLPHLLSWRKHPCFPDVFMKARSSIYKAPSWSWASMNCRVMYGRNRGRISTGDWFQLLDNHLEQAVDAYGPLKSGWLCLRGSLLPVKLTRPRKDNEPAHPETYPIIHYLFSNRSYSSNDCQVQLDGNPLSEIPQPRGTILYAFPIASYTYEVFRSLTALLLKPTGKKNGQYTRVGVLQLDLEALDDFTRTYRSQPKLESRLFQDYKSCDQTGALLTQEYVIELV